LPPWELKSHWKHLFHNKWTDNRQLAFSCVYIHSTSLSRMLFNLEYYQNTHSTEYRCTHYTLLLTARCFQSV
jgi:hypothetical protein